MRLTSAALSLTLFATAAAAQEDAVPPDLARLESERSRACVPALTALAALDARLAPLGRRADRIQVLARAIALEDSAEAAPYDPNRPLERAVLDWFGADRALALRFVETRDSALVVQRRTEREALRQSLRDTLEAIGGRGQEMIAAAGDVQAASQVCQGAILVRPAVLEVCADTSSPVCDAARALGEASPFRFVEAAEDLWDVVELRPWGEPNPLRLAADGTLAGARTATRARQGNVVVALRLGPLFRARTDLGEEEVLEFETNLDSLGFTFEHPDLVMAPALDVQMDIRAPLAGESHYLLHFGDLADPARDVIWQGPAGGQGPVQAVLPTSPATLARLRAGELVSLTAVRLTPGEGEDAAEAEALYTISLAAVNQSRAVGALLAYMAGGQLGRDLLALVPPSSGGS